MSRVKKNILLFVFCHLNQKNLQKFSQQVITNQIQYYGDRIA